MEAKFEEVYKKTKPSEPIPKSFIYSAHDSTVCQALEHLFPQYDWKQIPFASTIKVEMRLDNFCFDAQTQTRNFDECIKVRLKVNGQFLSLKDGNAFKDSQVVENPVTDQETNKSIKKQNAKIKKLQSTYDITYNEFKDTIAK